jgi:hypothetical protein
MFLSMTAYISASRPPLTVAAPGRSSFTRPRDLVSLITVGVSSKMAAATGTLMKNAARQLSKLTRAPPTSAPTVNPPDSNAPLRPRTLSRTGPSGKLLVSSDRAAGAAIAVAKPCSTRAVSSIAVLAANPPTSDAPISRTTPDRNSLRRPNRSASRPNIREKPAAGSAYPAVIHGSPVKPSPTLLPISGSATFSTEKSADSMTRHQGARTASTAAFRWSAEASLHKLSRAGPPALLAS